MVDLRSLEVFYWVIRLGGFGRAAERLHMTQPAVSARINQIEAMFGVRLLDRSRRVQAATPRGLELYGYAERMLALRSDLIARMTNPTDMVGTVRIGVAETLVHTLIGSLLTTLSGEHPGLTPEVTVDISPNLQLGLLGGELDVALMLGPSVDPRIKCAMLCEYQLVWVAAPALALPTRRLGAEDLAQVPILSYARGTLPHAQLTQLFNRPDLPPVRLFANSSLATILRMAADGIGVGALPLVIVERELAEGRLCRLDVDLELDPLRFVAATMAGPTTDAAQFVANRAVRLAQIHKLT